MKPMRIILGLFLLLNVVGFTLLYLNRHESVTVAPLYETVPAQAEHILFIGNSHTFVNDVPQMVQRINASHPGAAPLWVESLVEGGAKLERFAQSGMFERAAVAQPWTHIVLQGASHEPFSDPQNYIAHFRQMAHNAEASHIIPVLYEIWPRAAWDPLYEQPWMPVQNPEEASHIIRDISARAIETTSASLAPVSQAWMKASSQFPEIKLYHNDGNHAAPAGSYLAALVLFRTIRKQNIHVGQAWYPAPLSDADARKLQRLVNSL